MRIRWRWAVALLLCTSVAVGQLRWVKATRDYERPEVDEMATPIWQSIDKNWDTVTSWSTGAVPADQDLPIFDGSSQVSVALGLDQSAVDSLRGLWTKPAYSGDLGVPGNPLLLYLDHTTSARTFAVIEGSGACHIGVGNAGMIALFIVDSPNLVDALTLYSKAGVGDAAVIVIVKRGRVILDASMTKIFSIHVLGPNAYVDATAVNPAGGTKNEIVTIVGNAGVILNARDVDAAGYRIINNGAHIICGPTGGVSGVRNNAGTFEWNVPATAGGIAQLDVYGGAVLFNETAEPKTVTKAYIYGPDAIYETNDDVANPPKDYRPTWPKSD